MEKTDLELVLEELEANQATDPSINTLEENYNADDDTPSAFDKLLEAEEVTEEMLEENSSVFDEMLNEAAVAEGTTVEELQNVDETKFIDFDDEENK